MTVKQARWTWRFDSSPAVVWQAMGDTARFNEAAGFVKHAIREIVEDDGAVRFEAEARIGRFAVRWREHPVEWVADRGFRHARAFHNGPFRSLTATLTLTPEGAGTRADYLLEVEPRGLLGHAILAAGFFRKTGAKFERLVADAARFAVGQAELPFTPPPPSDLDQARRARLDDTLRRMIENGADAAITARLGRHVREAGEIDVARIRPLRLARAWATPARGTIETCLHGVKAGLLALRWDLLCPNCRGAKRAVSSLDALPSGAHCDSCNIDYERDFARNVELTFHPAPAIRAITDGEFCLFGPMTTPHVLVQQTLAPGETRDVSVELPAGAYRARALHPIGEISIDHAGGAFAGIIATPDGIVAGPPSPAGCVRLENRRAKPITLLIESRAWVADALTADRATSMQAFRDLFATEALRPGDDVKIARIALMFTDLRGSTALYARIGDGAAYRLVREHYAFLAETVRRHDGGVVKTIGDAIMAAFADPADAARAALDLQGRVADFNRAQGLADGIVIKLGLHGGPVIAVTLNDRLDYFGSTVNLAARLQGESRGGDIVISEEFAADPAVAAAIAGTRQTSESAAIKGFADAIPFRRLFPEG